MNAADLEVRMCAEIETALASPSKPKIPKTVDDAIKSLLEDGSSNCFLVCITNVALTSAEPAFQTNLLSKQAGGEDSRSLYKRGVRPALVEKAKSLGVNFKPSQDPFVSNPFREPKVDAGWVEKRRNKLAGADELLVILDWVEKNRLDAKEVLAALTNHLVAKLGRVDKRDSQRGRLLIQDCFLRSSHGSWGLVGCGVGADRAAAAA